MYLKIDTENVEAKLTKLCQSANNLYICFFLKMYNVKFFLRPLQSSSSSLSVSRVSLFLHPSPQKQASQQRMSFFLQAHLLFLHPVWHLHVVNSITTLRCWRINILGRNKVTILTARKFISFLGWQLQKRLCCILPDLTLVVSSLDMFRQLWFSRWQRITDKLFLGK